MFLINFLLICACVLVYGQNNTCDVCIIDSSCDENYIHFNLSVSEGCSVPFDMDFSYYADVDEVEQYESVTIDCGNCYFDLTIDPIRDAWVYTLTLDVAVTKKICSSFAAQCGGKASWLVWIITGSISGVFVLSGVSLCIIRSYRAHQHTKTTRKKIEAAVINS